MKERSEIEDKAIKFQALREIISKTLDFLIAPEHYLDKSVPQ